MTAATAMALAMTLSGNATAQFNNGAVIVTVPSSGDTEPSSNTPTPKAPPKARPKPKQRSSAKPRPAPRPATAGSTAADKLRIALLVNDDPITEYDITQRANLLAGEAGLGKQAQENFQRLIKRKSTNERLRQILQETVQSNPGRGREEILKIFESRKQAYAKSLQQEAISMARGSLLPGLRRKATQELIEERLKLQAAKQVNLLTSDKQLDEVMEGIAKRNKLTSAQFKEQLKRQGSDIYAMRARVRAQMSWNRLVSAKFGRFIDVNQKTIDESVGEGSNADKVSLHLHQ
ncbi:MAG: SurA N-terminal domain-containing protein, partial [Alphaproteobacteria bacterium]|nr:SurA N-terminal domain-containing protein [Alphaproteobacteria bacterium]